MGLIIALSTLLIAVVLFYDETQEKQEKHTKKKEQLQEYLPATHKTFAEQELEELKQKYDIEDVSQKESLTERSEETQIISLDIHIENGKITSIEETNAKYDKLSKSEELNKAFREMTI